MMGSGRMSLAWLRCSTAQASRPAMRPKAKATPRAVHGRDCISLEWNRQSSYHAK
jgi:hypothetical protein